MVKTLTQLLTVCLMMCASSQTFAESNGFVRITDEQSASVENDFVPPSPIQLAGFHTSSCDSCTNDGCTGCVSSPCDYAYMSGMCGCDSCRVRRGHHGCRHGQCDACEYGVCDGTGICRGHGRCKGCKHCRGAGYCDNCHGKGCKQCMGPLKRFVHCKFGFLFPSGCGGKGCPPFGHYGMVYAVDPGYADPRDSQVYAAEGYGMPMAVPLAPTVRHTYNYSWGVPASRITPISVPGPSVTY